MIVTADRIKKMKNSKKIFYKDCSLGLLKPVQPLVLAKLLMSKQNYKASFIFISKT